MSTIEAQGEPATAPLPERAGECEASCESSDTLTAPRVTLEELRDIRYQNAPFYRTYE